MSYRIFRERMMILKQTHIHVNNVPHHSLEIAFIWYYILKFGLI